MKPKKMSQEERDENLRAVIGDAMFNAQRKAGGRAPGRQEIFQVRDEPRTLLLVTPCLRGFVLSVQCGGRQWIVEPAGEC